MGALASPRPLWWSERLSTHSTTFPGPSALIVGSRRLSHNVIINHTTIDQVLTSMGPELACTGLILVNSHRHRDYFRLHARALHHAHSTSSSTALNGASLLIFNNNAELLRHGRQMELLNWLDEYRKLPLRMRMLLVTRLNWGLLCSELHALAATVRIWARYQWVLAFSGPDIMLTPFGLQRLDEMLARETPPSRAACASTSGRCHRMSARRNARPSIDSEKHAALYAMRFPAPRGQRRLSMDLFLFSVTDFVTCDQEAGGLDASLWGGAFAQCVEAPGEGDPERMPETLLHDIVIRHKLPTSLFSHEKLPEGGSQSASAKEKARAPVRWAVVWHAHNLSNVADWLSRSSGR